MHVASFLKVGRGQQTYPKFNKQKKNQTNKHPPHKKNRFANLQNPYTSAN